jgi:hypothetical protein
MIREDHFRQGFVVGQSHPAWIATGIRLLHQLEITNDVLIVERVSVKFFEQVKSDVRLVLKQSVADDIQLVVKPDGINVMAHFFQSRNDVKLRLDFQLLFFAQAVERVWRQKVLVSEHDDSQLLFRLKRQLLLLLFRV